MRGYRARRVSCISRSTPRPWAVHGRSSCSSPAATSRPVSPATTSTRWRRRWPGEAPWSWWASGGRAASWAARSPDSFADVACAIGVARRIGPAFRAKPDRVVLAGHSMSTRPVAVIGLTATAFTPAPGSCDATAGSLRPDAWADLAGPGDDVATAASDDRELSGILRRDTGSDPAAWAAGIRSHWRPIAPSPPPTSRSCSPWWPGQRCLCRAGIPGRPRGRPATTAGSSRSLQPITSGPPSRRSRSRRSSPWRPRSRFASYDALRCEEPRPQAPRPGSTMGWPCGVVRAASVQAS